MHSQILCYSLQGTSSQDSGAPHLVPLQTKQLQALSRGANQPLPLLTNPVHFLWSDKQLGPLQMSPGLHSPSLTLGCMHHW